MTKPTLGTVIVNNYNYGRFLADAIESALNQTHAPTQVIVVDDGSTDHSRDVIASYKNRIVAVLKENEGQASAFNAGYARSNGDVVVFLDADDTLAPTALERAIAMFANPNVVKVQWQLNVINERGVRTGVLMPGSAPDEGDLRQRVIEYGPLSHTIAPTSGNAWAKHFLNQVFPVQESGDKHGADTYLLALASYFGLIKTIHPPQGCYRIHPDNFNQDDGAAKVKRHLRRLDFNCTVVAEHLRRLGITFDPSDWKRPGSQRAWLEEAYLSAQQAGDIIPPGAHYILVDDGRFGSAWLDGRHSFPFREHDGVYWGPPADDAEALRELNRLCALGATHIVFIRDTMWWLDHYTALREHLDRNFKCEIATGSLAVFSLPAT